MSTVENCLRIPNGEQKRLDIQAFRHPTKSFRLVWVERFELSTS